MALAARSASLCRCTTHSRSVRSSVRTTVRSSSSAQTLRRPGACTRAATATAAAAARPATTRAATTRTAAAGAAAAARTGETPHIQLATAKLPAAADEAAFLGQLYQHFATLTQNGRNLPFVLPLRVDRLPCGGFTIALLRRASGGAKSGDFAPSVEIAGVVEDVPEAAARVLFLRMYEGPAAFAGRAPPKDVNPDARLELVIQSHPDIDTLMTTAAPAIRKAAAVALGAV